MSLTKLLRAINDWFFGPDDTWGLSLFRVLLALVFLNKFLFLLPDLNYWFTENGILPFGSAITLTGIERFNLFYTLRSVDSVTLAYGMWTVALVATITFGLGLATRVSAVVLYLVTFSFDVRNPLVMHGGDTLIRVLLFWMMFARSNAHFSLDLLLARRRGRTIPTSASAWPRRALQIQVAIMYLATFWHKSEGQGWWSGTAIYTVGQLIEFRRYSIPFLYSSWLIIKISTWFTLLFEASFALLVWFRETRRYILAIGVLFHLGLEWHLLIPIFQVASIASYAVFCDRSDFNWLKKTKPVVV